MPRFFTENIVDDRALLTGEDAAHIAKSLRMAPGEELTLCDCKGSDYRCVVESVSPGQVELRVLERTATLSEPKVQLTLYQALPKGDKLEQIVQKAVELGAVRIVPVLSSRCISRPDGKSMAKKLEKLRRTALEAAKQSGRGLIPKVGELLPFDRAVTEAANADLPLFFYEEATEPLREALAVAAGETRNVSVFIGSEGGFSREEAESAREKGLRWASLGPRILRCETAPVAAIAAVLYGLGEF
ncbi:MAG: RsmE family RNA methyltransferase [Oscillospiraceae bacterium]